MSDAAQERIKALMEKKAELEAKRKKMAEIKAAAKGGDTSALLNLPAHLGGDSGAMQAMRARIEELKTKNAALLAAKAQQKDMVAEQKKIEEEEKREKELRGKKNS